jgi:23S rRNA-intervening sequence protein
MLEGRNAGKLDIRGQKSEGRDQKLKRINTIKKMIINSAKDLKIYQAAYELAMEIFEITKQWPKEEIYSLIDQIRRSSRSVCSNLREAWLPARRAVYVLCLCN